MIVSKQTTGFKSIQADLQTGDLILMEGIHLSSRCIELLEGSTFSHVGIIVRSEDIDLDFGENKLLLWESDTPTPVKDVIKGIAKSGPMLVDLSERLKYNFTHGEDSKCSIRQLHTQRDDAFKERFKKLIPTIHDSVFPDTWHEFLNPTKGRLFHKKTSLDTMFCSELAAYTYIKLGLLSDIHPVNSYLPVDFSEQLSVSLLKRAWLSNEISIDLDILEDE
jgi:hypothetical protein